MRTVQDPGVQVEIKVNGRTYGESVDPRKLLSDFLREDCGLTGTHVGCEHGVCGACTVLVDGVAMRSCLIFAVQAEGSEITTVEGLVHEPVGKALRDSFSSHHALQCGFCTSGILSSAAEYIDSGGTSNRRTIQELLSGHLCRCTGYRGIVDAIEEVAEEQGKDGD